ncbi:MAG: hydantoinase/oxoprolinase family protein [Deltaproteobacteria bacterium]|nr:hydantoinase/oxoprolinase family protein [Deltaproteobacteria bacterium]
MHVAIDTGGTFTDAIAWDGGRLAAVKVASSRADPARSVLEAVRRLEAVLGRAATTVTLGTTVATNALLERRGSRVGLVTSRGFEDVLRIGRQERPSLYALDVHPVVSLVDERDVCGVDAAGSLVPTGLDWADLGAVAVCLVRALDAPEREGRAADVVRRALAAAGNRDARVVESLRVLPEMGEHERMATTVADAYVGPAVRSFVQGVAVGLGRSAVRVHVSAGGSVPAVAACERPVLTVLSGPAGGASGASALSERKSIGTALAMDVGGTSTDVALVRAREGGVAWTTEGVVAGVPIAVAMVEVHTIGAGGGSIVRIDEAGALRVGPESAGAFPGPAAYGRGGARATLTDAHVVLGHLGAADDGDERRSATLADGVSLDRDLAVAVVRALAERLGVSVEQVAARACEAADFAMARALRRVSVERGIDPRDACLVAFGGAGGLHGATVAALLGIRRVIVPALAGVLSAAGILAAPASRLLGRAVVTQGPDAIADVLTELVRDARRMLDDEGVPSAQQRIERVIEARYRSQTAVVALPVAAAWESSEAVARDWPSAVERFRDAHARRYGFELDRDMEIVAVRVRASGPALRIDARAATGGAPSTTSMRGAALSAREGVAGPDVIADPFGTTFVPDGWMARRDLDGDLELTPSR